MKRIAILGATGHIGKALTYRFSLRNKGFEVYLFARSLDKLKNFVAEVKGGHKLNTFLIKDFNMYGYDVVINCIGMGTPSAIKDTGMEIFSVTEEFDSLILRYLEKNPKTLYINLSSGAVYGKDFRKPVISEAKTAIDINRLQQEDNYSIAKINSEAKHRYLSHLNIVDLRVFSFFSRFIDLDAGFLLSDLIKYLKEKKTFVTSPEDIIRDYVVPEDLFNLINLCIKKNKINDFFDVYSARPVSKVRLLNFLKSKYGLSYSLTASFPSQSPTGSKFAYYSMSKKAAALGYTPKNSSLQGINNEIKYLL